MWAWSDRAIAHNHVYYIKKDYIGLDLVRTEAVQTYSERLPLAPAGHKAEALGLDRHASALDVLFYIPEEEVFMYVNGAHHNTHYNMCYNCKRRLLQLLLCCILNYKSHRPTY